MLAIEPACGPLPVVMSGEDVLEVALGRGPLVADDVLVAQRCAALEQDVRTGVGSVAGPVVRLDGGEGRATALRSGRGETSPRDLYHDRPLHTVLRHDFLLTADGLGRACRTRSARNSAACGPL